MALLRAALNWRPKTPFYYGWLVLGMAFLGAFAATGISQTVMGGIQGFIADDLEWSNSTIAIAVTAGTWSSGLITPFVGRLTDWYGPRWLMAVGAIAAGASMLVLAGVHSVWQFYLFYILGRAFSNSVLMGVVPRTTAVNFFRSKRNIALSLTAMSRPVGGAINIQLISAIATSQSWRSAFRYLGVVSLVLTIPLVLIMRRRPEDIGLLPDGAQSQPRITTRPDSSAVSQSPDQQYSWTAGQALPTRSFWILAVVATLGTLGSSVIGFNLVPFLQEEAGVSKIQAAGVLSIGTFLAVANLGWGLLADRFTPQKCLIAALLLSGLVVGFMFTVNSLATAYVFGILWGLFAGSVGILEHMVLAQYFGRGSYGSISGTFAPLQTGALGLGPVLGAFTRDFTGSNTALNVGLIVIYLIAASLVLAARPPSLPSEARS